MSGLDLERKYDWYEIAVQNPSGEVDFMRKWYRKFRGSMPRTLREDFCGTGAISCDWARRGTEQRAWGVDLDPEPLAMGKVRHLAKLPAKARARMTYVNGNVLDRSPVTADVVCAFNFSYMIFKSRPQLLRYFKAVRRGLGKNGVFFLDLFGGPESQTVLEEYRKIGDLTYYWDCQAFNPITADCTFAIHFRKGRGPKHENVFTYDWRLWTLAELRDLLTEAGFARSVAFMEGDGDDGTGDGVYVPAEVVENCDAWVSYIAALV